MSMQTKTSNPTGLPETQPLDTLPTDGLIRISPLARLIGIHPQTLRRWWKNGLFPRPQRRNGILLFRNSDVKEWINKQPSIIA